MTFRRRQLAPLKLMALLLVNQRHVTVRYQLNFGDQLEVQLPIEVPSANLTPYMKPLDILFEDDYIIIVSKPNGQNCAPSREHPHESLVEQVLGYLHHKGERTNPHIVTRLDRNTTGIVLLRNMDIYIIYFQKPKWTKFIRV